MSLDNLVGRTLEKIDSDSSAIKRLLVSAERNIADYSGDIVPASAVDECVRYAENLLHDVNYWLRENKPELF